MRSLLNFLFANLVPIIIVVSVVIRILRGIRNSSASRGKRAAPVPVPREQDNDDEGDVWSRLRPDDDDEEERDTPSSPAYKGPGGNYGALYGQTTVVPREPEDRPWESFSRPLLMPAPSLIEPPPPPPVNPDPGIARPFDPVTAGIEPITAEPGGKHRGTGAAYSPGPLDRLNSLPPLRRAVVLAEILGKPKGLG